MDGFQSYQRREKVPPGIYCAVKLRGKDFGLDEYRVFILVLTFIAYACYHASRKPLSIVKSVLDPEGPNLGRLHHAVHQSHFLTITEARRLNSLSPHSYHNNSWTNAPVGSPVASIPASSSEVGWDPFNGNLGKARLGEIDMAFLASYAIGMYFAGRLGDRLDLRKFLTVGMVASGAFVCLFGMGYWWNIHLFSYYFIVQVITGLLSATGWPAVVAVVANWFGKTKRGLIMGVWNAHASVGNIAGSFIAAGVLHYGWGWSFVFPGIAIMMTGFLVFLFLVVEPAHVGLPSPYEVDGGTDEGQWTESQSHEERKALLAESEIRSRVPDFLMAMEENELCSQGAPEIPVSDGVSWQPYGSVKEDSNYSGGEESKILEGHNKGLYSAEGDDNVAIGFFEAWKIPGVALFAFCLFFVKLVAYTFLYWLPFYIRHTEIAGEYYSDKMAGYLSTVFDVGGVIGGIMAGHLSDKYNVKAIVAAIFVYCSVPAMYLFHVYGGVSLVHAVALMILSGIFVNGPYALITTAVCADLGTHSSLKGNARALATVTAIIDGTGSVGAAVGPFLTGYISDRSWTAVFMMLALASLVAGLLLTKLVVAEIMEKGASHSAVAMDEPRQEELTEL